MFSLSVSPQKATLPLESGVTIAATVGPAGAGAQFSLAAGTTSPAAGTAATAEFAMDQELHDTSFPSGKLGSAAFTTTRHVRTLDERNGKLVFVIRRLSS